jgi:hypothetical protein
MNTVKPFKTLIRLASLVLFPLFITIITNIALVSAAEIAPPKYNLVDRMSVNMATGQLQVSQTDVSIGGAQGLSHVVMRHSSEFFGGFQDNFNRGSVYRTVHLAGGNVSAQVSVIRVHGMGVTVDFRYTASGGSYTSFTALNDPRNTLAFVAGTGLVLTLADGTEFIYFTNSFTLNSPQVAITRVRYPNGLQLTFNRLASNGALSSVRTNTGFQLKYRYVDDNRPLDSAKQSSSMETGLSADSLSWSRGNPKQIVALNNSVEHCDVASSFCSLSNTWPTASYQWPAGMPRAMAVGQSNFSVTDAEGRTTDYDHTAIDKALALPNSSWLNGILPGTRSSPRITSIDLPNNSAINYQYENQVVQNNATAGFGLSYPRWFPDGYGILKGATHDTESMSYTPVTRVGQGSDTYNNSVGYQAIYRVEHNNEKGVIRNAFMADKIIRREDSFENKIKHIAELRRAVCQTFVYDSRLNITEVKEHDGIATNQACNGSQSYLLTIAKASYPASCNTGNRKYCNKASWTEDANGRRTNYTYHAASGQVATVTSPADEKNVRAQVRYAYTQKTPTHSGADLSPVWMLASERFCRNSAYNGSGCSANDETVISYQYETENLLLIGQAITASGKTLRTCYRYDRFARQIGQTEPNANINSCSN